ncbi:hypothetical protein AZE42_12787 [Rhizopogon vesiculosus]|uniref:Uncharacterized protein n=1 Tax=Rhizopogon vesiculosus TaxID=180088 RepID=A0A1J8R029_9AGAM|nr:hypothetical protein AZE42_12787 [Rhizopogon vesiculosus]
MTAKTLFLRQTASLSVWFLRE